MLPEFLILAKPSHTARAGASPPVTRQCSSRLPVMEAHRWTFRKRQPSQAAHSEKRRNETEWINNQRKGIMAIKLEEGNDGKVLEVALTDRLAEEDYEMFVPVVERLVRRHGKIRMLVAMHGFHGWTAGALWEDTKYAAHHFRDIERLALAGETEWQHGTAVFCRHFTTAEVRYFDHTAMSEARTWLEGN
jgi:hypothetical protein